LKKRALIISAIEAHDVGCPVLVTFVALIESILNKLAM
jgi:hypothetical protein